VSAGLELLPRPFRLDVHPRGCGPGLAEDARAGLAAAPKALPPKHFYDERGSELFERITRLPEYYQSRTELRILRRVADGIVARHGTGELVELGSGASRKTAVLLDAMRDAALLERYVPFDVCPEAILAAAGRLAPEYPGLEVHGVAGDFARHLTAVPERRGAPRLVALLGGTIGNLEPGERAPFLASVAELLGEGDLLLVGTDLAGDPPGPPWIGMWLRARSPQLVRVAALGVEVRFECGEEMRTEVSCKFTRESVASMYAAAGLRLAEWHEDPRGWFAVSLARLA
jgi:L-histidine N-alpha-methyltransferase